MRSKSIIVLSVLSLLLASVGPVAADEVADGPVTHTLTGPVEVVWYDLWSTTYDGVECCEEGSTDLTLSSTGVLFVTGEQQEYPPGTRWGSPQTIAYSSESGEELWSDLYYSPGTRGWGDRVLDGPLGIALVSYNTSENRGHLLSYDPTGAMLWDVSLGGVSSSWVYPYLQAVANSEGDAYVAVDELIVGDWGIGIHLYALDGATGTVLWDVLLDSDRTFGHLRATAIAVDDNKVALGYYDDDTGVGRVAAFDPETGSPLWDVAPPDQQWNWRTGLELGPNGDVYAFGSGSAWRIGFLVTKLDSTSGTVVWQATHNTTDGYLHDGTVGANGDVIVTGRGGSRPSYYIDTLALDAATGTVLWRSNTEPGDSYAGEWITTGPDGTVYVTGASDWGEQSDYVTIAYEPSTGEVLWTALFDNSTGFDEPYGIVAGPEGRVYVTGFSCAHDPANECDFGTVAYGPLTPSNAIEALVSDVEALNLGNGLANSLSAKLANALDVLDDANESNDIAAINNLEAFINQVQAQAGKKIPQEDADALITAAQQIIDLLLD